MYTLKIDIIVAIQYYRFRMCSQRIEECQTFFASSRWCSVAIATQSYILHMNNMQAIYTVYIEALIKQSQYSVKAYSSITLSKLNDFSLFFCIKYKGVCSGKEKRIDYLTAFQKIHKLL